MLKQQKSNNRSCVVCRQRREKYELLRFVLSDDDVACDRSGTMPGRGAWVCGDGTCKSDSQLSVWLWASLKRKSRKQARGLKVKILEFEN